ncbi:MAG TPA: aspartyl/asparaginyl beta-hydroxylase domain-containing protein [Rhizomicrobium sp.]
MKLDEPLIRLFDYPTGDILAALPDADSPLWDVDQSRQKTYPVHRLTRSIIFDWLDNAWEIGGPVNVKRYDYVPAALAGPVYACADRLQRHYGGKLVRMTLAELRARAKIPGHVDNGVGVTAVHRCHIPIVSNEQVKFYIDRVPYYLEPNVAYEFDNTRAHAVENLSDQRRVHLLCDFMPAELVAAAA